MRGGKLIAFVDPYSYFDQQPTLPGVPPMPSESTLPTLVKAWGIEFDANKVISDVVFGSGGGARYTPTVLSLNRTAFSRDDVVRAPVGPWPYPLAGPFAVKPPEGLRAPNPFHTRPTPMLAKNREPPKRATKRTPPSSPAA